MDRSSAPSEASRRPGILVVDDDAGIRENIADLLSSENYEVVSAANADEAMRVLESQRIDLLLTAFQMPGRNGVELIEAARRANHRVPAILMTAYLYVFEQMDARRREGVTLLRKPFDAVEAADERAHILGPGLCGEDRLIRGEDEGRVDLHALGREGLDRLQPLRRHLDLHDDVLVKLRELPPLLDHLVGGGCRDLQRNRPVHEGQDVLDHLGPLATRLRDQRRIGRHAIEDAPGGGLSDLVDVRGVEEDLDHGRRRRPKARGPT